MKNKKQNRFTLVMIGLALVVIIILIVILNAASYSSPPEGEMRVSLSDAKVAFDAGEALFVDVRGSEEFVTSHIPGAVLIQLSEISGNEPAVDKGALIYTYCT